jgi:hypothetical protein
MYKRILLISILCMVSLAGHSPPNGILTINREMPIEPFLKLFKAVVIVESNGDATTFNKSSKATGIAQITPILLRDYNKRSGKSYTLNDCYDKKISKSIFMFYCMLPRTSDFEYIAKRWNGSGKATEKYWTRIKSKLKKQKN